MAAIKHERWKVVEYLCNVGGDALIFLQDKHNRNALTLVQDNSQTPKHILQHLHLKFKEADVLQD